MPHSAPTAFPRAIPLKSLSLSTPLFPVLQMRRLRSGVNSGPVCGKVGAGCRVSCPTLLGLGGLLNLPVLLPGA